MLKIIFVILLFAQIDLKSQTILVDGEATCYQRNELFKYTSEETVRLYVDDENNIYISFGSNEIIPSRAFFYSYEKTDLLDKLNKYLEWSQIAKKEKADIEKDIATFTKKTQEVVPEMGNFKVDHTFGARLIFHSEESGKKRYLLIYVKDYELKKSLSEIMFYMDDSNVKKLIKLIKKTAIAYEKLKNNNKEDLFK